MSFLGNNWAYSNLLKNPFYSRSQTLSLFWNKTNISEYIINLIHTIGECPLDLLYNIMRRKSTILLAHLANISQFCINMGVTYQQKKPLLNFALQKGIAGYYSKYPSKTTPAWSSCLPLARESHQPLTNWLLPAPFFMSLHRLVGSIQTRFTPGEHDIVRTQWCPIRSIHIDSIAAPKVRLMDKGS